MSQRWNGRRFEVVEQTVQATHRYQHGDQLGEPERGDAATEHGGEVGVRVVRHARTLSNIRSIIINPKPKKFC